MTDSIVVPSLSWIDDRGMFPTPTAPARCSGKPKCPVPPRRQRRPWTGHDSRYVSAWRRSRLRPAFSAARLSMPRLRNHPRPGPAGLVDAIGSTPDVATPAGKRRRDLGREPALAHRTETGRRRDAFGERRRKACNAASSAVLRNHLRTAVASRAVTKPAQRTTAAPACSRLPPERHGVPPCASTGRSAGSEPRRRPTRPVSGRGGSTRISWLNQNDFGTSCLTGVRRNDAGGRFQPKCSISSPLAARKTAPVSGQTDITASTGIHISSFAPWSPVA